MTSLQQVSANSGASLFLVQATSPLNLEMKILSFENEFFLNEVSLTTFLSDIYHESILLRERLEINLINKFPGNGYARAALPLPSLPGKNYDDNNNNHSKNNNKNNDN